MKRCDARTQRWKELEINDVRGLFCDARIDRNTVPRQYRMYELADCRDGVPCKYARRILVNFYGTFVTDLAMSLGRDGAADIKEENYSFLGGIYDNFDDAIKWLEGK